jgi:hypothetical protein
MSPHDIQTKYGRHIASEPDPQNTEVKPEVTEVKPEVTEVKPEVTEVKPESTEVKPEVAQPQPQPEPQPQQAEAPKPASKTPKLDALLASVEVPARQNPVNLNHDMLKEDISSLLSRVAKAEEFDKATVQKTELDKLREDIKLSAIELRQIENSLKDLMNPEDVDDLPSRISEAKIHLEASLKDLELVEYIVANRPAEAPATTAPEVKPEVAEAKPEETKPVERAPSVVNEETKPEAKTEEKDPILCALEEQNKLLQTQLQSFVQQQSMIMQQLMGLSQMVMMQNMYRTPDTFNYAQAYQYHQPQVAGNWVYYPDGLQPIQPGQTLPGQQSQANIFGLNNNQAAQGMPMPQMPMGGYGMGGYGMGMGMYGLQQPGMMNQMPGQWGLAPQASFAHTPGNFSMDTQGFNFGGPAPQVGMF